MTKVRLTSKEVPEAEKRLAEVSLSRYCVVPERVRDKLRLVYRWRGNSVAIFEERPYFMDRSRWTSGPVAQFRYDAGAKRWVLYWRDRNSNWHHYERTRPAKSIQTLLEEVEADPTGIFWG